MNKKLREKVRESFSSVLPITAIVLVLSVVFVPIDIGAAALFLVGAMLLVIGMGFFQLGAETAMTPLGESMGVQLTRSKHIISVIVIGFFMGLLITIAEPDLQVLANQVPSIPNMALIVTVACGVGIFLTVGILRVLFKISLSTLLLISYTALFILCLFVPNEFLAVAFDAGGVTTGPITVPFIIAMGVGLASVRGDRDASDDSFGFVALSSVGPILAVMLLGIFYNPESASYVSSAIPIIDTTRDVIVEFAQNLPTYGKEVLISLVPILAVFFVFQLITKRFLRRQRRRMLVGYVYTFLGLVLFLTGVNVGFLPVGLLLGGELATGATKWLLIPLGMLIGYFIVKAEPAAHVLNRQVEDVTNGAVTAKAMSLSLSIGVSVSVGLSMLRVITGISIFYILIPGYIIAIILSRLVPKIFVGIAFDAGGVASGPMTTTFLLPLAIGACEALGGNVMMDAFGIVALVAMTPLIAVQIMGLLYKYKRRSEDEDEDTILEADEEDDIVEYEEE